MGYGIRSRGGRWQLCLLPRPPSPSPSPSCEASNRVRVPPSDTHGPVPDPNAGKGKVAAHGEPGCLPRAAVHPLRGEPRGPGQGVLVGLRLGHRPALCRGPGQLAATSGFNS